MLCWECDSIVLKSSSDYQRSLIRQFHDIWHLKKLSRSCDFCNLVYTNVSDLESDPFPYCLRLWGKDLFHEALKTTTIDVNYVTHVKGCDITISYKVDIFRQRGYQKGPRQGFCERQLGGFWVDNDSSLAEFILGRRVDTSPKPNTMLDRVSQWYEQCQISHVECGSKAHAAPSPLPTRVLDVSNSNAGRPLPFLVQPASGTTGIYATLSYVWGHDSGVQLRSTTITQFETTGVLFEDLPTTLRDAIVLTQHLGIRYLWIDALCIIQDSGHDWEEQCAQMCQVFSNSILVIRAASGADSYHGLFNTSTRVEAQEAPLKMLSTADMPVLCLTRSRPHIKEPLDSRSWALQEAYLAKRTITFGSSEMSWDCRQAHLNESGTPRLDLRQNGFMIPQRNHLDLTLVSSSSQSDTHAAQSNVDVWQGIVMQYCRRKLTFTKDRLPALAGLARRYAETCVNFDTDRYLAGLWLSQLPQSLVWHVGKISGVFASKYPNYLAPTWSWASLDCPNLKWLAIPRNEHHFAEIQSAEVSLLGEDLYGQVQKAHIMIKAPIKKALLLPDAYYQDLTEIWAKESIQQYYTRTPGSLGAALGRIVFDTGEPQPSDPGEKEVTCLRITETAGLIIELVEEPTGNTWKRIGLVQFYESSVPWWQDCIPSVVKLI